MEIVLPNRHVLVIGANSLTGSSVRVDGGMTDYPDFAPGG